MSLLNLWNGGGTNCAIDASGATLTGNAQLHFGTLTTCNVGLQNMYAIANNRNRFGGLQNV